ncbi:hypothetical protein [Micromonospora phytophila]|uniref:hypothetical protein n=1 Tax=Micromonospora phytophila TaxID=709888 RepID=UPI00202F7EB8|nr:hypothetical protein [Micromonospora phytophila]
MRDLLGLPALAVATLATWWCWLGWDTRYTVDPVTGSTSGPYEPWQVVGCVLTLALLAALGGWYLNPLLAAATMTATFTVAWSWRAASTDDSGLWVVGAVLVLVGMAAGSTAVSFGAHRLRRDRGDRGRG